MYRSYDSLKSFIKRLFTGSVPLPGENHENFHVMLRPDGSIVYCWVEDGRNTQYMSGFVLRGVHDTGRADIGFVGVEA